jgi:signal transduction histidine kinase
MTAHARPRHEREGSSTLQRLSASGLWGRELAVIAFALNAFLTLLMDVLRQNSASWLWFVPSFGSYAVAFALGWLARKAASKFEDNPRVWMLNILLAAVIGAVKNVIVGTVADAIGLVNDATLQFRIVGGAIMGVSIVFIVAVTTGARIDHRAAVARLEEIQIRLLKHRERLQEIVAAENSTLVNTTQELLIPKLRKIENLLVDPEKLKPVVDELRSTIEGSLRPLTRTVESFSLANVSTPPAPSVMKISRTKLPKLASTALLLQPTRTFIFNILTVGIFMYFFLSTIGIAYAVLAVSIETLIHWTVKRLLPVRPIARRLAVLQLALISGLGAMPALAVVTLTFAQNTQYVVAILVCLSISTIGGVLGGYARVLDEERVRVEQEISLDNETLAHDIALYEQKIWVFRKSWQLLLHGTVQAALTAALTRLALPNNDKSVTVELVRQDLKRAEAALVAQPTRDIDLNNSIEELTSAWKGVCDVTVKVSERASRALKRNFEAMFGTNEIMREAVSNSVRHGAATRVVIEIDRIDDEVLDFVARNDGIPLVEQTSKGVGSQMMDELTTEWSISTEDSSGLTALRARIPVSL